MTVDQIRVLIYKSLDGKENGFNAENEKTAILNVEHAIGKYHAYMNVLEALDLDTFVVVAEETKTRITELMQFVEKIYR